MSCTRDTQGQLQVESVPLQAIAEQVGTPTYVYSKADFVAQYTKLSEAFTGIDHSICYAVKANSNLSVLRLFHDLGAGFDIVSAGELQRVVAAGGDPGRVIFSGVGKSISDIDFALHHRIRCFNVESAAELQRLSERAQLLGTSANVSIRVNPNVDARTHPYISTGLKENKFGVPPELALQLYEQAAADAALHVTGIDCHIGSQIAELGPLAEAFTNLLELVDELATRGIPIQHVDVGGGMGVTYRDEQEFDVAAYGSLLNQSLANRDLQLMLEPGRFLVANGGLLLTAVEYLKPAADPDGKNFAVVDAAMNDLIRPALYQAWHNIDVVAPSNTTARNWDVVGPVCETGDFLGHDRQLALAPDSLLAVGSAGAYGMVQSSNYNSRGRAAEVLVDGDRFAVIRRRETVRDQLALETQALANPAYLECT